MRHGEDQEEECSNENGEKQCVQGKKVGGGCVEMQQEREMGVTGNQHFWLGLWELFIEAQNTRRYVSLGSKKMSSVLRLV